MHSTQLTIIIIGMILGFAPIPYFIRKAILRAMERNYQRGLSNGKAQSTRLWVLVEKLSDTQMRLTKQVNLLQQAKLHPLTEADHRLLVAISGSLNLSLQTWRPLKGTELVQARVNAQQQKLEGLITRVLHMLEVAALLRKVEGENAA